MTSAELIKGGLLLAVFVLAGSAHADVRVFFVEPTNGATVTGPILVICGLDGIALAKAGELDPNKGRHHLLIDAGPMQKGLVIPANDRSLRLDNMQTETVIKLSPGDRTLTLQFSDSWHQSFGPEMSQTIEIHVK